MVARIDHACRCFKPVVPERIEHDADLRVDEAAKCEIGGNRLKALFVTIEEVVLPNHAVQGLYPRVTFISFLWMQLRQRDVLYGIHVEELAGGNKGIVWCNKPDIEHPRLIVRGSGTRFQPFASRVGALAIVEIVVRDAGTDFVEHPPRFR